MSFATKISFFTISISSVLCVFHIGRLLNIVNRNEDFAVIPVFSILLSIVQFISVIVYLNFMSGIYSYMDYFNGGKAVYLGAVTNLLWFCFGFSIANIISTTLSLILE